MSPPPYFLQFLQFHCCENTITTCQGFSIKDIFPKFGNFPDYLVIRFLKDASGWFHFKLPSFLFMVVKLCIVLGESFTNDACYMLTSRCQQCFCSLYQYIIVGGWGSISAGVSQSQCCMWPGDYWGLLCVYIVEFLYLLVSLYVSLTSHHCHTTLAPTPCPILLSYISYVLLQVVGCPIIYYHCHATLAPTPYPILITCISYVLLQVVL